MKVDVFLLATICYILNMMIKNVKLVVRIDKLKFNLLFLLTN